MFIFKLDNLVSELSQVSNDWLVVLQGEVNLNLVESILQQVSTLLWL